MLRLGPFNFKLGGLNIDDVLIYLVSGVVCILYFASSASIEFSHLLQHWINLHLRCANDLVGDCLFHEIDFALPDDLHKLVWKRYCQLLYHSLRLCWLSTLSLNALKTVCTSSLSEASFCTCSLAMLGGWKHQERIILARKVNIFSKVTLV
jgi:hypothetical protein